MTAGLNVQYFPNFYSPAEADDIFKRLCDAVPFRTTRKTSKGNNRRKIFAYSQAGFFKYPYSGITVPSEPFTPLMNDIKRRVESSTTRFNFALLNYYEDGQVGIAAHRDDESCMDLECPIACVSFGSTRKIIFRPLSGSTQKVCMDVEHGSLYWMKPPTNDLWTHEIPKQKNVKDPRISITFRKFKIRK